MHHPFNEDRDHDCRVGKSRWRGRAKGPLGLSTSYELCNAVMSILADIATLESDKLPLTSTVIYVGRFCHRRSRISLRLLGPTRLDGGLVMLTHEQRNNAPRHEAFVLDDLYSETTKHCTCAEYASNLDGLVTKAVRRRNRALKGTTNYFAGGRVVKIL